MAVDVFSRSKWVCTEIRDGLKLWLEYRGELNELLEWRQRHQAEPMFDALARWNISPAVEQPMMRDSGNASSNARKTAGRSRSAAAPKAITSAYQATAQITQVNFYQGNNLGIIFNDQNLAPIQGFTSLPGEELA